MMDVTVTSLIAKWSPQAKRRTHKGLCVQSKFTREGIAFIHFEQWWQGGQHLAARGGLRLHFRAIKFQQNNS
jgi:hypothetical protein